MTKRSLQEENSRPLKKLRNDIATCVSKLIKETVFPEYKELRAEIAKHPFLSMRLNLGMFNPETGDELNAGVWSKVLFALSDCAIVQEVLLTWNVTRFKIYKISFGDEWDSKFVEFIDEDHDRYDDIHESWEEGMREYGAGI